MAEMVRMVCPIAYEAFDDYVINAHTFSGPEMKLLRDIIGSHKVDEDQWKSHGISKREGRELMDKLSQTPTEPTNESE
jgi:hypothetical protein